MTNIEARRIEYLINWYDGSRKVTGYALRLPEPWSDVMLCARREDAFFVDIGWGDLWSIDHYLTGLSVRDDWLKARTLGDLMIRLHSFLKGAKPHHIDRLRHAGAVEATERVPGSAT